MAVTQHRPHNHCICGFLLHIPIVTIFLISCEVQEIILHLGFIRETIFRRNSKRIHLLLYINRVNHGECLLSCVNFHAASCLVWLITVSKWDLQEFILQMNGYLYQAFAWKISS